MRFRLFLSSQHGSTHILYSIISGAIAVAALGAAYLIDHQIKSKNGMAYAAAARLMGKSTAPTTVTTSTVSSLRQVTVDYEPTSSTPTNLISGQIVLDPCTGARKN